jgi:hypothetical protein
VTYEKKRNTEISYFHGKFLSSTLDALGEVFKRSFSYQFSSLVSSSKYFQQQVTYVTKKKARKRREEKRGERKR